MALIATGQVVNKARDDGTLELLFSQPISRGAFFSAISSVRFLVLLVPLALLMAGVGVFGRLVFGQDIAWSFQCYMSVATFGDYDSMPDFFTHEQKLKGVAVGKGARNAAAMMLEHDVFMVGGSDMFSPAYGPRMKEDITCRVNMVNYPAAHALNMSTGNAGSCGASAARQASSPWVKVVSMPLPE